MPEIIEKSVPDSFDMTTDIKNDETAVIFRAYDIAA